jgi:hypothetical protein
MAKITAKQTQNTRETPWQPSQQTPGPRKGRARSRNPSSKRGSFQQKRVLSFFSLASTSGLLWPGSLPYCYRCFMARAVPVWVKKWRGSKSGGSLSVLVSRTLRPLVERVLVLTYISLACKMNLAEARALMSLHHCWRPKRPLKRPPRSLLFFGAQTRREAAPRPPGVAHAQATGEGRGWGWRAGGGAVGASAEGGCARLFLCLLVGRFFYRCFLFLMSRAPTRARRTAAPGRGALPGSYAPAHARCPPPFRASTLSWRPLVVVALFLCLAEASGWRPCARPDTPCRRSN